MSTDNDTAPAAETERAEPLSTLTSDGHEAIRQVGEDPPAAPAAQAAPATPAPVAETKVDPAAKPEAEQPFWYRKEIAKEREAKKALERELAQERARAPQREAGPEDDPNRPLTRAELEAYRNHDALIGRLERSEERFVDKLGEETFDATKEWLATRPDIEEWALKQRDPWKAAHSQFTKEKLAAEIGEDPTAWRAAEKERLRQELRAEMDAERDQHTPARRDPPQMRSAPPAPSSTVRSAAPRDDAGRFAGPAPIGALSKHKFS